MNHVCLISKLFAQSRGGQICFTASRSVSRLIATNSIIRPNIRADARSVGVSCVLRAGGGCAHPPFRYDGEFHLRIRVYLIVSTAIREHIFYGMH